MVDPEPMGNIWLKPKLRIQSWTSAAALRLSLNFPPYTTWYPRWKIWTGFLPAFFLFHTLPPSPVLFLSLSVTTSCLHVALWDSNGISLHMKMECWYLLCFIPGSGAAGFVAHLINPWHFLQAVLAGAAGGLTSTAAASGLHKATWVTLCAQCSRHLLKDWGPQSICASALMVTPIAVPQFKVRFCQELRSVAILIIDDNNVINFHENSKLI